MSTTNDPMAAPHTQTMVAWTRTVDTYVDHMVRHGKAPPAHGAFNRCLRWTIFPVCTAPCFVWSFVWRLVACPYQCVCNGPYAAGGNNCCTNCSDVFIGSCINENTARAEAPTAAPPTTLASASLAELIRIRKIVDNLLLHENTGGCWKLHDVSDSLIKHLGTLNTDDTRYSALTKLRLSINKEILKLKQEDI